MADESTGNPVSPVVEAYNGYWSALGRFIDAFALVESIIFIALVAQTRVDFKISKAIYSGVRIDTAKNYINRARESLGLGEHPGLNRALAQLTEITKVRNDLVHYGAKFNGEAFTVSNAFLALTAERRRSTSITVDTFDNMIYDLETINSILMVFAVEVGIPTSGITVDQDGFFLTTFRDRGNAPWRYTPQPQSQPQKRRPLSDPTQSRPPKP